MNQPINPIPSTCTFVKPNHEPCKRKVQRGEGRCWQHAGWRRKWRALSPGQAIAVIGFIFAVITTVFALIPTVVVERDVVLDPRDPFTARFTIQNLSNYAIHDLRPACTPSNVSVSGIRVVDNVIAFDDEAKAVLWKSGKSTASCSLALLMGGRPNVGDHTAVRFLVAYKIPLGIKGCQATDFSVMRNSENRFVWTYQGASGCPWGYKAAPMPKVALAP